MEATTVGDPPRQEARSAADADAAATPATAADPDQRPPPAAAVQRRLAGVTRGSRRFLVVSVVLGVATAVAVTGQAWFLSTVASGAFVRGRTLSELVVPVLALLGVVVARALIAWGSERSAVRASVSAKSALRRALAERAATGPSTGASGPTGGPAAIAVLATTGIDALDGYFSRYLPQVFLAVIVPLTVIAVMAANDWISAVIVAVTVPLIPLFGALVGAATREHSDRELRTLQRLAAHFYDVVAGLPTLKVFGRAKAQAKAIEESSERYRVATMSTLRISFLSSLVLELVATVSVALVAVAVGLRLLGGHLPFSTALFVLVLAPEAYLPLRALGTHYHASAAGIAAAEQVFTVLDRPVGTGRVGTGRLGLAVPELTRSGLAVEGLSVVHAGRRRPAPDGLTFTVATGEVVALVGPSGSGKSTVLSVLCGLTAPTRGSVWIGGTDLAALDLESWRSTLAWVPQRPHLFTASVTDNVLLAEPGAGPRALHAAMADACLDEVVARLPDGAATRLGSRGVGLSHGERQRVALARLFLRDAPVLLLDEPTAHLDGRTEDAVVEALARRTIGRTVLLVTHRPALLGLADRIVELTPAEVGR